MQATDDDVMLGAYRWYLSITPSVANVSMKFKFGKFQDSNTTSVPEINSTLEYDDKYYDIHGRAFDYPIKSGIYIYKGEKIYHNKNR